MNRRLGLTAIFSKWTQSVIPCAGYRLIDQYRRLELAILRKQVASFNQTPHSLEHLESFAGIVIQQECSYTLSDVHLTLCRNECSHGNELTFQLLPALKELQSAWYGVLGLSQ